MLSVENIIALVGIVVTAIFSGLVWKATEATARATRETLNLNERLAAAEEKRVNDQWFTMRSLLKPEIINETRKVDNALDSSDPMIVLKRLGSAPTDLSISSEDLSKYFTAVEADTITRAWRSYKNFREKHYRLTYRGDEVNVLVDQGTAVSEEMKKILSILD